MTASGICACFVQPLIFADSEFLFTEKSRALLLYLIGVIGTFGEAMLLHLFYQRTGSLELILKIPYEYNHIFSFLASVGLFCLFLDSDIRGKIGSVAVKIAPYTLGVYLLHENLGVRYAWQKWLGSDRIDGAVSLLLWTVIAVIVVFVLGILVDVIRKISVVDCIRYSCTFVLIVCLRKNPGSR